MFQVEGSVVGFSCQFHSLNTGALEDPSSPEAELRITPFGGTATYSALSTPTKLNSKTGWYGGEYTIPATPTKGLYEIIMRGNVTDAAGTGTVQQGATVATFWVGVADGQRMDEILNLLHAVANGEIAVGGGGAFTISDPSGANTRITGTRTGSGRSDITETPAT